MRVLAVMAHPDDIEFTCAGTLVLLRRAGWDVHLATMTAGDLGTATLSRAAIARIRKEAAASARLLGAAYTCLGFADLTIVYNDATKRRVSALLRLVRPDLVIVPSPVDYMADHEETPRIVREAAFASTVPNWKASLGGRRPRPCAKLPAILYADPIDNVDHFGRRVAAQLVVDITGTIDFKEEMLAPQCSDPGSATSTGRRIPALDAPGGRGSCSRLRPGQREVCRRVRNSRPWLTGRGSPDGGVGEAAREEPPVAVGGE